MHTIAFYNLKGGVGKTAAAVNVAWHAARWKNRTLLWDLDPQGAASFYLGVEGEKAYTPGSLLKGKQPLNRLITPSRWPGLDVIPANESLRNLDVKLADAGQRRTRLRKLLQPLQADYDLVILDCPPTLSPLAESIFGATDYLFVPVIPTHLSLRAFTQVSEWIDQHRLNKLQVIPFYNMVDRRRLLHVEMLVDPPQALKNRLKSWIPYSTHVEQMGEHGSPINEYAPYTPAARAFRALWFEIAETLGL